MEGFAAFAIIILVGLAIPITLIFAALTFDLVVLLYAMFRFWRDQAWPRLRQLAPHYGIARIAGEVRGSIRQPMHYRA